MNTKTVKAIVGWVAFIAVLIAIVVPLSALIEKRDQEHERNVRFHGACDYLGGHVATFDEGESYVCIKNGKVVARG